MIRSAPPLRSSFVKGKKYYHYEGLLCNQLVEGSTPPAGSLFYSKGL